MQTCARAGCGASSADPRADGWHLPADEDPRGGHNVNALLLCPRCWGACLRIGFTL